MQTGIQTCVSIHSCTYKVILSGGNDTRTTRSMLKSRCNNQKSTKQMSYHPFSLVYFSHRPSFAAAIFIFRVGSLLAPPIIIYRLYCIVGYKMKVKRPSNGFNIERYAHTFFCLCLLASYKMEIHTLSINMASP